MIHYNLTYDIVKTLVRLADEEHSLDRMTGFYIDMAPNKNGHFLRYVVVWENYHKTLKGTAQLMRADGTTGYKGNIFQDSPPNISGHLFTDELTIQEVTQIKYFFRYFRRAVGGNRRECHINPTWGEADIILRY